MEAPYINLGSDGKAESVGCGCCSGYEKPTKAELSDYVAYLREQLQIAEALLEDREEEEEEEED